MHMERMWISVVVVCAGTLFLSCREDFTVSSETNAPGRSGILLNSSFELGGGSTLLGWTASNEQLTTFLRDTPSGGGEWSLSIASSPAPGAFIEARFAASAGTAQYRVSVWAKYLRTPGTISIIQKSLNTTTVRASISVQDTAWSSHVLVDTLSTVAGDSIGVRLSGGVTETTTGTVTYDLCLFERL
jgi:hypothetical protein